MGNNPFDIFSFKSKKQREKEARAYDAWAFPHGLAQREKIEALLKAIFPRETAQISMFSYLSARGAYLDRDGDFEDEPDFDPVAEALRVLRTNTVLPKGTDLFPLIALIEADSAVDETLAYPDMAALLARAEALRERYPLKK